MKIDQTDILRSDGKKNIIPRSENKSKQASLRQRIQQEQRDGSRAWIYAQKEVQRLEEKFGSALEKMESMIMDLRHENMEKDKRIRYLERMVLDIAYP